MSDGNGVTVNVNGGGGGRQRGPGLFSNLGRAPWYVQLALLIVIGYLVLIVGFEILASVYDFAIPTFLDFARDPRAAGAALGASISAAISGVWSTTGGAANRRLQSTGLYRFAQNLPSVRVASWANEKIWGPPKNSGGGGGGF